MALTVGLVAGLGLIPSIGADPAAAVGPSVVVVPTSGVSWGDTLTVTTSGYPTQEAAYITLCDPGTIGTPLTVQPDFGVGPACAGEIEHRFQGNPDTNYGFINGANGSDTVVLTDGRPSSAHCATGTCDLVVFDHNCIDNPPGATCAYLGQTLTFAASIPHIVIKGKGVTLRYRPVKTRVLWSGPLPPVPCTTQNQALTITNETRHTVQPTYLGSAFGAPLPSGATEGICVFGTGKATYQYGLQGSVNLLTVKVH